MKNKVSLFVLIGSLISSTNIMAKEYDNHYIEYMYENYIGKKRAIPVEFDITEQNLQENKNIIMPKFADKKIELKKQKEVEEIEETEDTIEEIEEITEETEGTIEEIEETTEETEGTAEEIEETTEETEDTAEETEKSNEEWNFEKTFYTQFNYGISKFNNYKTNFTRYAINSAIMEADSNEPTYGFALGRTFNNWNVEAEINKADYKKIETQDINKTYLIEYNQKIKSLSLGVNLIYNFNPLSYTKIIPFAGAGLGYSQFKIYDFGKVWAHNGKPVISGTVGAMETNFEAGPEKQNTLYIKALAGVDIAIKDNINMILSFDYRIYDDIKTDNKLELKEMNSFNINAGLRFNF